MAGPLLGAGALRLSLPSPHLAAGLEDGGGGVADEMTPGEIQRWLDDLRATQRATNDRLAKAAGDMVSAALWAAEKAALADRLERHEREALRMQQAVESGLGREIRDVKELLERAVADLQRETKAVREESAKEVKAAREKCAEEIKNLRTEFSKRSELTWQKAIGLIGALAAIALVVATLVTAGGK